MKIIEGTISGQNVTFLPDEILSVIFAYVYNTQPHNAAQKDLCSCCMVSPSWYASGVSILYKAPLLTSRNFPEFAQTLCPPSSNRSRRVGLENFLEYLDMGALAYESKKSTTSRLLSRTKGSLKSFTAPAVSFSTTSLAPLSKCVDLQYLDLSRDKYDFSLSSLMHSIRKLQKLTYLNLPKNILPWDSGGWYSMRNESCYWPPNLQYLVFNQSALNSNPEDVEQVTTLLQSFPATLTDLSFLNCDEYFALRALEVTEAQVPQVSHLHIAVRAADDNCSFPRLMQAFPNLRKVTIPGMTSWLLRGFMFLANHMSYTITALPPESSPKAPQELEIVVLEESPDFPGSSHINIAMLESFVKYCPKLVRIEVPEAYLDLDDTIDSESNLDQLNVQLYERARPLISNMKAQLRLEDCGVFATESPKNAHVGLKRSVRARR